MTALRLLRGRRPVRPGDVRRFGAALRSPARASAARALVDGLVVAVVLRRRGLRPLLPHRGPAGPEDVVRTRAVAAAVDAGLGLLPLSPTCLRRSVTLLREMERVGLPGQLHLGVRREAGRVDAHAWVQVSGAVVNDDPAEVARYYELAAGDVERVLAGLR